MKSLLRLLFLPLLVLLFAAGCTAVAEVTAVSANPTATPQPTAETAVVAEPTATSSYNAYNPDITLLSATGRPQFVTAYADW